MNLDDLRSAQVDERGTDSLQPLRPDFYAKAEAYLSDLRERRDRLADEVDDPYAEEVRRLTDELETAEEVVEAIYERRVGKLVKRASLAAAGMPADEEGLTEEEQALFRDLVERIEDNRAAVLEAMGGDGSLPKPESEGSPAAEPAPEPPEDLAPPEEEPALDAGEAMGAEPEPAEEPEASEPDPDPEPDGGSAAEPAGDDEDRLTVRITAPVGEIYGVDDRVYTLDAEDVVTLPTPNAKPLLDRGAAQRID